MPINIPNFICLLFCTAEIIYCSLWPHLTHFDSLANIYVSYIISAISDLVTITLCSVFFQGTENDCEAHDKKRKDFVWILNWMV